LGPALGLRYFFAFQAAGVIARLRRKEAAHVQALVELARRAVTMAWGIPPDRLDAELTSTVAFGKLSAPRTLVAGSCGPVPWAMAAS
jgi:hypothetical protein